METMEERISVLEHNVAQLMCQNYAYLLLLVSLSENHANRAAVLDRALVLGDVLHDLSLFESVPESTREVLKLRAQHLLNAMKTGMP